MDWPADDPRAAGDPPPEPPLLPPPPVPPPPLATPQAVTLTIRRVDVASAARAAAIIGAVIGLPLQLVRMIGVVPFALMGGGAHMPSGLGLGVVLIPLTYALAGGIAGALGAVVYNWSARTTGGVQVDVG